MQKVIVIGCPGAGKSTFARALAAKTGLPLYHLDLFFWREDKTTVPRAEFLRHLHHVLREDTWIIDGNYGSTMELRMAACDTVFFLDYPLDVCLAGIRERKGRARPDFPFHFPAVEKNDAFYQFVEHYESESRPKVLELLSRYKDKQVILFKSRDEAAAYLATLEA